MPPCLSGLDFRKIKFDELDFYCLCSLQNSVHQTWFSKIKWLVPTCPHLIWKWSTGPGLLCSSGCCSQIVSTMGTLLHGDRIPERNRSNFKRQKMQNRYPCYLLTQTFSCNNFNFTSASVLIGSDFCLTQICHSLQHLTQLLLHLA